MDENIIIAYSATSISISARFIFMYLLYTKRSTNIYSLIFCLLNITSSSLWITYSLNIDELPLLIRSTSDLFLFTISSSYIIYNRRFKEKTIKRKNKKWREIEDDNDNDNDNEMEREKGNEIVKIIEIKIENNIITPTEKQNSENL